MFEPLPGVAYPSAQAIAGFIERGLWLPQTVGDALRATARRVPAAVALVADGRSITYAEYDAASESLGAALLELGLRPRDRVMFQMGSSIETAIALVACFKAGLIPVCTLPQHRDVEIGTISAITKAAGYIVQADASKTFDLVSFAAGVVSGHATLRHLVVARGRGAYAGHDFDTLVNSIPPDQARARLLAHQVAPEDVLVFQLSGGTTGSPKVIPRIHAEYVAYCHAWNQLAGLEERDVGLWALPLIHNAAMIYHLIPSLLQGRKLVLMDRFEVAAFFGLIESEKVTHTGSIGPIVAKILEYPAAKRHDLSRLRLFTTLSRAEELERHMGVPVTNVYGISEGILLSTHPKDPVQARHKTVGRAVSSGDEFRLMEIGREREVPFGHTGELAFRGPSMVRSYYGTDSDLLSVDGFFRTGDLMKQHLIEGGSYFSFEGRIKDNIDRGGEKFGPEEIEDVIAGHPSVADVKVVAMPDAVYGEKPCAFIIARSGCGVPSVTEMADYLVLRGLAKFKIPERIEAVTEFPQTRVGKIDRASLRERAAVLASQPPSASKQESV